MAFNTIPLVEKDLSQRSALYQIKLSFNGAQTTLPYAVPINIVNEISLTTAGAGTVQVFATNYPTADIDAGTAEWALWDGVRGFNNATTAFYFNNVSGVKTVVLTIRGQI